MKIITNILPFLFLTLSVNGQVPELVKTHDIKSSPACVSIDRYDNFYIADSRGDITKYDVEGKEVVKFSPQKTGDITLFESWNYVNTYVFYKDFQEYLLLDRFLAPSPRFRFNENVIGFAAAATISQDNNMWVVDNIDFSLKKVDLNTQQVIINSPLDLVLDPNDYEINYIREYQNLLFIEDVNTGMLIFDNLGNYKKEIPVNSTLNFNFFGDYLYYISDTAIHFQHLYSLKNLEVELPKGHKDFKFILVNNKYIYFFTRKKIFFYKNPIKLEKE